MIDLSATEIKGIFKPDDGPPATSGGSDDQPVTHRVLGDRPWLDEMEQVVRPTGLGAGSGQPVSAERLARDHRTGDAAVHVQIADRGPVTDVADSRRITGEQAAGQGERQPVDDLAAVLDAAHALDRQ